MTAERNGNVGGCHLGITPIVACGALIGAAAPYIGNLWCVYRRSALAAEDDALLAKDGDPPNDWVSAVEEGIGYASCRPETARELADRGLIDEDRAKACEADGYRARYEGRAKRLAGAPIWVALVLPCALLGGAAAAGTGSLNAAGAAAAAAAIAFGDARHRSISPVLTAVLAGCGLAARGCSPALAGALGAALLVCGLALSRWAPALGGEFGTGDALLIAAMVATLADGGKVFAFATVLAAELACTLLWRRAKKLDSKIALAPYLVIPYLVGLVWPLASVA